MQSYQDQLLEYLPTNEKEELRKLITQYGPDQGYKTFKKRLAVGHKERLKIRKKMSINFERLNFLILNLYLIDNSVPKTR